MISLVVPTYNERDNIAELVERTGKALAATGEPYELIIVDDNSADGTADEVRRLAKSHPWLRVLVREKERDLSTAVTAGWQVAQGDVFGCMDADLQHPPEVLTQMVKRLREGNNDIIVGSRHVDGGSVGEWNPVRKFVSWTATFMTSVVIPQTLGSVHDPMSGFFLVRRDVMQDAVLRPLGYKILLEVLAKGKYKHIEEVPFVFADRTRGESKISSRIIVQFLKHLCRIFVDTGEAARLMKFGVVGCSGVLVNALTLRWFLRSFHWDLALAALVAAAIAIVNNFAWNEVFTFREAREVHPGVLSLLRRFSCFTLFSSAGVGIYLAVILLARKAGLRLAPAAISGIGAAAVWNYLTSSLVSWRDWWKVPQPAVSSASREPELKPVSAEVEQKSALRSMAKAR